MKTRMLTVICLGGTLLMGTMFSGCETLSLQSDSSARPGKGKGPPAHAPAHGYRKKHQDGTNLVYDSGLGLYGVVDFPGVYHFDNKYFRYLDGRWQVRVALRDAWVSATTRDVPASLKKKHPGKGKAKGKNKGDDKRGKGRGRKK